MGGLEPMKTGVNKKQRFQENKFWNLCIWKNIGQILVRMRGLEPPCLTALAPKTSVSTIPPHPRVGNSAILREITEKSYTGSVL